jgi:hypothetical protein
VTRIVVAVVVVLAAASGRAWAYPQYQLSRDATCSACHVSPAGGGMLTENGMMIADSMSQWGTAPEFINGKVPLPKWLALGGDGRAVWGYLQTPQRYLLGFPMQIDLYANVAIAPAHLTVHVTAGYRPPEYRNEAATRVWSREHYVMWQQDAGANEGLFVRAGRFMPVFGLRFAEHPIYTRRYGGTQLYGETYGVAVEYVKEKYEGHVTGFIRDPLIDPVEHANGAAGYGEYRVTKQLSIGGEGMISVTPDDKKFRGGVTAKLFLPKPDLLLQTELQFVNQRIRGGGAPNQIVGYLMGSKFIGNALMLDLGLGHYDENIRIKGLDRDCVDVNMHWFVTSHFEASLNARVEFIGLGSGGPTGAFAFLQGHYRL